ncbi:putative amidoligase enzyme-domain-containing protein [Hypoxylon cercidicola]|nr:putative amidoligase enzyme-domain-containing protein [Hypoxylon cercidicola]
MSASRGEWLTFGVELEFYITWETVPGSMKKPARLGDHPGGPLLVDGYYNVLDSLAEAINPLLNNMPTRGIVEPRRRQHINSTYLEWSVKPDGSLLLSDQMMGESRDDITYPYGWRGVELVSPVLLANRDGFNEVLQVVEFIRNNFWTETTENAGLHIHIGNGNQWFPPTPLRHIACLLYAADPVIAQCHPEHRRQNRLFAPSNRLFSNVSFGMKTHQTDQHPPEPEDEAEQLHSPARINRAWRDILRPLDFFGWLYALNEDREAENFPPRPTEGAYKINPDDWELNLRLDRFNRYMGIAPASPESAKQFTVIPMLQVMEQLLASTTRDTLAQLMKAGAQRAAYNFDSHLYGRQFTKRTIEFRQPASTLDAAEILFQVVTAAALTHFAFQASYGQLMKVVLDCNVAEDEPSFYDVYDLLLDLGLRNEARFLSRTSNVETRSDDAGKEYLRSLGLI